LMSSKVEKYVPLWTMFGAGKSQKSLRAKSGGYSGSMWKGMFFSEEFLQHKRYMLGTLLRCRNHWPCPTCPSASSEMLRITPAII
jgi:hypothetical protein